MKSHWKTYKGVRIFYYDISGFGSDESHLNAETAAARAVILAEPKNSILILTDAHGTDPTVEGIKVLQKSAEETNPFIAKAAVIGVTGPKMILLQLVNRFVKRQFVAFDDFDAAADWLVKDRAAN